MIKDKRQTEQWRYCKVIPSGLSTAESRLAQTESLAHSATKLNNPDV